MEIYLAGGCFWGVQHFLSLIPGVTDTIVGYANGNKDNPTYEEVCSNQFGFTETVKVLYNSKEITLQQLLKKFFLVIDPTSINKQGNDVGLQYRTGIYCVDNQQLAIAEEQLNILQQKFEKKIVVECQKIKNFFPAENYHQDYLEKNPGGYCHISPSLFELAKK